MKGAAVVLYERTQTGTDAFNDPVYAETAVNVQNVLIGEPTTDEVTSSVELYGRKIEYMLGLPKGDSHNWEDATVEIFGKKFRTFGATIQGIEENVPTPWHKKVRVCRYE